jgi:aldose 1-epimerase
MDDRFCKNPITMSTTTGATKESFGKLPDGRDVGIFTLTNRHGLKARVTEYGAILVSLEAPDRLGNLADLTHGFDTLDEWVRNNDPYYGATVGRFGNRIAGGKFSLDGIDYSLVTNNAPGGIPCHLHGGTTGFDKVLWVGKAVNQSVEFSRVSPAGEEGYPGSLDVRVTYTLTDENELIWEASAVTDAPTIINMVHHTYWNLSGDPRSTILNHEMTLHADHYLPTDAGLIPTGEIAPVAGTPMDFTRPQALGARIDEDFKPLEYGAGYDHCWILREGGGVRPAARLRDPKSGRVMEVLTNQPAIQCYAAYYLDGVTPGKNGVPYASRTAIAMETEGFPDAPNKPGFPSCVLRPGEIYTHTLVHRFSVE